MQLIKQPNSWSCFPTALAMCMNIPVQAILDVVGHDGSGIIWPGLPEPFNRRSFHGNELIVAAWKLGFSITYFDSRPVLGSYDNRSLDLPEYDLTMLLNTQVGVLTGVGSFKTPHAVAWEPSVRRIYDPNNTIYELEKFIVKDFYVVTRRKGMLTNSLGQIV